jgi:hypothetical protein
MAHFESGVKDYVRTRATVEVYFPVDWRGSADISCSQCFFFRRNYQTCGLNGEVCQYPNKYVGDSCPLEPVEENADDQTDNPA